MTLYNASPEIEPELVRAGRVLRRANAFFLSNLARLVDITRLRDGNGEEDYVVDVPANQLHEVDQRIADLELAVYERFDVGISVLPIPVPA